MNVRNGDGVERREERVYTRGCIKRAEQWPGRRRWMGRARVRSVPTANSVGSVGVGARHTGRGQLRHLPLVKNPKFEQILNCRRGCSLAPAWGL